MSVFKLTPYEDVMIYFRVSQVVGHERTYGGSQPGPSSLHSLQVWHQIQAITKAKLLTERVRRPLLGCAGLVTLSTNSENQKQFSISLLLYFSICLILKIASHFPMPLQAVFYSKSFPLYIPPQRERCVKTLTAQS